MIKLKVNNKAEFTADPREHSLNGKKMDWDSIEIKDGLFHILINNKSYNAEVLSADHAEKKFLIRVNGNSYTVEASDRYDELLKQLGMDKSSSAKINDLKAPMPGMVLDVLATEDKQVKKGEAVIVLEAMKMENILKAAGDTIVKKVLVKKGDKVEKGQVLLIYNV